MKMEWNSAKMADVFDLQMGKTPDRSNAAFWNGSETWVAIGDMGESKYISSSKEMITSEAVSVSGIKRVPANTVIMSFKLSVGKVAIAKSDLYTNEAIMAFNVKPGYDILPEYVYYYLKGYKWQGSNRAVMGVTLNKASISQGNFKYPDSQEQSRIVSELDLLTGIIDKQNAQLKELNNLAQAIFYDMFGDPIENPKRWEVKKLGDVCSVVNGLVNPNEEPFCNYPHIGGANIQSNTGVFVDVKLAKDEGLISGKYLFDESMILYSKIRPNLNKVALPSFKGICSADMYPLITNTDVANKYYIKFSITHKKFIEYAVSHSGRANIPKINRDALLAYDLPLPPLALQQSFAEKIQSIEKQKETFRASIADTQKLLDYTMDKYFG